jgi:hypothetical protein
MIPKRLKTEEYPPASETITSHYNSRPDLGEQARRMSRVLRVRKFNNAVKALLIERAVALVRAKHGTEHAVSVLDMAGGKGGDLVRHAPWTS